MHSAFIHTAQIETHSEGGLVDASVLSIGGVAVGTNRVPQYYAGAPEKHQDLKELILKGFFDSFLIAYLKNCDGLHGSVSLRNDQIVMAGICLVPILFIHRWLSLSTPCAGVCLTAIKINHRVITESSKKVYDVIELNSTPPKKRVQNVILAIVPHHSQKSNRTIKMYRFIAFAAVSLKDNLKKKKYLLLSYCCPN